MWCCLLFLSCSLNLSIAPRAREKEKEKEERFHKKTYLIIHVSQYKYIQGKPTIEEPTGSGLVSTGSGEEPVRICEAGEAPCPCEESRKGKGKGKGKGMLSLVDKKKLHRFIILELMSLFFIKLFFCYVVMPYIVSTVTF